MICLSCHKHFSNSKEEKKFEERKFHVESIPNNDGLATCRFLVLLSRFESLSIVVLETMKSRKPVLIHENCEVVKGHCIRSNGGLYYQNYYEFEGCTNYLLENRDVCEEMGINGEKYVDENYRWEAIVERLSKLIMEI